MGVFWFGKKFKTDTYTKKEINNLLKELKESIILKDTYSRDELNKMFKKLKGDVDSIDNEINTKIDGNIKKITNLENKNEEINNNITSINEKNNEINNNLIKLGKTVEEQELTIKENRSVAFALRKGLEMDFSNELKPVYTGIDAAYIFTNSMGHNERMYGQVYCYCLLNKKPEEVVNITMDENTEFNKILYFKGSVIRQEKVGPQPFKIFIEDIGKYPEYVKIEKKSDRTFTVKFPNTIAYNFLKFNLYIYFVSNTVPDRRGKK